MKWRDLDGNVWSTTEARGQRIIEDNDAKIAHDYAGHLETIQAGGYVSCFCVQEPFTQKIYSATKDTASKRISRA